MPTIDKTILDSKTKTEHTYSYTTTSNLSDGWQMARFGDVVRNIDISIRDPEAAGIERVVGLEHLDPGSLHIKRWNSVTEGTSFTRKFTQGQVLFGKRRAYQRKVALATFDGICSGDILVFEPEGDTLLAELLPFIVQSDGFFDHALGTSAGSLSPRTRWRDLAEYRFPLPPRDEQRRIAELLWAADEAVEAYKVVIAEQQALKQSLLKTFFSESQIKETITLGLVGNWLSGGTPSRSNSSYWNGPIPWASPKDMKVDVLDATEEHISVEGSKNGTRLVPAGTILIVVRGMILAHTFPIAITSREMAFNQDLKALIANSKFNSKFIFYWFQYKALDILSLVSDSSHGTKRLPTELLFSLKVPQFDLVIQRQVVETLQQVDQGLNQAKKHCLATQDLKKRLAQALISPNSKLV
jgi:type I restriction enzyme S subunit